MASEHQEQRPDGGYTLAVEATAAAPALLLRPWSRQDIPAMLAAHRDPLMQRWLRKPITSEEEARQIIQARRADGRAGTRFSFAVLQADPSGGAPALVGSVVVRGLGDDSVAGQVGYWVVASARGRGVAGRALSAACEWAFRLPRARPLERLELIHAIGNLRSCRVADKAGFCLSATLPPLPPEFPDDGHLHIRTP
jgi:RimJ/RimL family protein N-acetyltransferase